MDSKYPHWYYGCEEMFPCGDFDQKQMMFDGCIPDCYEAKFKDRLLCLLGDEVLLSVDARICRQDSFRGTLCYVGCDFIIVNTCIHRRALSMHIPIKAIRIIAPCQN